MGGYDDLQAFALPDIRAEAVGLPRPVRRSDAEQQRRACLPNPDFDRVHAMPLRPLACTKQEQDGAGRTSIATTRLISPDLPVMTAFRVRVQRKCLYDGGS